VDSVDGDGVSQALISIGASVESSFFSVGDSWAKYGAKSVRSFTSVRV